MLLVVLPVSLMTGDDTERRLYQRSEVFGNETSSHPRLCSRQDRQPLSDALKSLLDGDANEKVYGRILLILLSLSWITKPLLMSWVISITLMINGLNFWVNRRVQELKKTVNYMVKEFEMKKSATSMLACYLKTALDMGVLILTSSMMNCSRK